MAEDDNINDLTDPEDYQEDQVRRRITSSNKRGKREKPCRTRFDVLAIPKKRAILDVYQNHAHHFPKERVENIKHKLQELYAMSPEETEKYFEQLSNESNELARQKMMKILLKRMYRQQQREKQVAKAYRFVEKLLNIGMMHAFNNPVPPLISVRLRNLSDIILEQICDLRNLDIPDRDNDDQCGMFLLNVADWLAIAIEHIYYGVQLKKNEELANIEEQVAIQDKETKDKKERKVEKEKEKETEKTEDVTEMTEVTEEASVAPDFDLTDTDIME